MALRKRPDFFKAMGLRQSRHTAPKEITGDFIVNPRTDPLHPKCVQEYETAVYVAEIIFIARKPFTDR